VHLKKKKDFFVLFWKIRCWFYHDTPCIFYNMRCAIVSRSVIASNRGSYSYFSCSSHDLPLPHGEGRGKSSKCPNLVTVVQSAGYWDIACPTLFRPIHSFSLFSSVRGRVGGSRLSFFES